MIWTAGSAEFAAGCTSEGAAAAAKAAAAGCGEVATVAEQPLGGLGESSNIEASSLFDLNRRVLDWRSP